MKITFSRSITAIVMIAMFSLLPVSCLVGSYPPASFTISWLIFCGIVEICNMRMKIVKHKREDSDTFINSMIKLLKDNDISNNDIINLAKEIKEVIS